MATNARPLVSNEFGEVYRDRIAFNTSKGWFSGGAVEELPVRHITSIRCETSRSVGLGLLLLLIGLVGLSSGGGGILLGLVAGDIGLLLLMGWPSVTINTAGGDLRRASGNPFQRPAADAFSAAARKSLFPE